MSQVPDIIVWIAAGALLFGGVFLLRFVIKFAWRILKIVLLAASAFLIAGYFFGFLDIVFH
jgi:hypothetical protein